MARSTQSNITISEHQLETVIRKIVRQVVREEFRRALKQPEVVEKWMSNPESPLYQDMLELRREIREGKVELLNDREVWGT